MDRELIKISFSKQSRLIAIRDAIDAVLDFIEVSSRERNQLITALSELIRNTMEYAREGHLVVSVREGVTRWKILFTLSDKGPGISDLGAFMEGIYRFRRGKGLGIVSAKRLLHHFEIRSTPGVGTEIHGALNVIHLNEEKLDSPDLGPFRTKALAAFLSQEAYQ